MLLFASFALALVVWLTAAEVLCGAKLPGERVGNVGVWALHVLTGMCLFPLIAVSLPYSLVEGNKLPFALGFALYFVAMDLGEYLFHRAQHAIPLLWKLHALHHSDTDMTATTTVRHFWGDQFLKFGTVWLAAAFVVQPSPAQAFAYALAAQWNFAAHARLPWSFGRLSWALNSPAYHRRHHSSLPEHYNSNFAAILPIWDVLLGSYRVPSNGMPPTGLGGPPPTAAQLLCWPLQFHRITRRWRSVRQPSVSAD